MPINSIRLENFKCFSDSDIIPIAPLTVIFGKNNVGKSSILQSLLVLRQTMDSSEYGSRLNLRGPLYEAGNYHDLVYEHASKQRIMLHFGVTIGTPEVTAATISLEYCSAEPDPPRMSRLRIEGDSYLPVEFHRGRGSGGPLELWIGNERIGGERAGSFMFPPTSLLPHLFTQLSQRSSDRVSRSRMWARRIMSEFESSIKGMRALGAFRDRPQRRYDYKGRLPGLSISGSDSVIQALIEDANRSRKRGQLVNAVNDWLKSVGGVQIMKIRPISNKARIFDIRLKEVKSGQWANFADVGFGIGQALPVFVEGLRTDPEAVFVVQEPEIHLHPDAQLRMADFLIHLVRAGRRVIVETHSENLLLRIRHAVILGNDHQGRNGIWLEKSDVRFIHVDKSHKGSQCKILNIDELGQVADWPSGFMEEATEERMALMTDMGKVAQKSS